MNRIKRALISVYDKSGIVPFAKTLHGLGIQIISTGGTAEALKKAGVPVKEVSSVTEFPEMLNGRVKTLHPHIHAGLLALRDNPEHIKTLEKHHIQGTFFLTGKFLEENPGVAKEIAKAGHEIFNHTYNHLDLSTLSSNMIGQELISMDKKLLEVTGHSSKPYFRPPYGSRNNKVLGAAKSAGFRSVYWSIDALDWKPGETDEKVKNRILNNLKPGVIYLMHLGDNISGKILDEVFTEIEKKGYKIVPLTSGL